jgi:UDP-glucose dehydrogenase
MKIAIIGQGYVGKAIKELFEGYYETITYDPKLNPEYPKDAIDKCELAIICVPTPMSGDGRCDTSIVESTVDRLSNTHILIKSTIPPGTTNYLRNKTGKNISFSPEYIGESTYFNPIHKNIKDTKFLIVGSSPDEAEYLFNVFEPILGPHTQYFQCTPTEAELIKYMVNSFLATKVSFVNEFYEISQLYNTDWHKVREGWLLDERMGRSFSSVFTNNRGFGGKCLPKDVNAIVTASEDDGYSPNLLKQVLDSNKYFQDKN